MRNFRNLLSVYIFAFIFIFVPSFSQGQVLEKGRVIGKVFCQYDRSQSYALYLPSAYSPEKKWPIIYAFDPGARGIIPVGLFQEAAEKYGYILAGSNNSQNGPWDDNARAANAIWSDTHINFSIDDGRIYATGFSGGARMASGLSHLLKKPVAGIMACGAGLPNWLKPDKIAPAAFFGMAGLADMNYKELKRLDREFDSLNTTHRIRTFDGPHDWPPKELCEEAVEWMELQAIKTGKQEKDKEILEQLYDQGLEKARRYKESESIHEAFQVYMALIEDFSGMVDVSKAEAGAEQFKSDPDFLIKQGQERLTHEEELRSMKRLRENFWQIGKNIGDPARIANLVKRFHLDELLAEANDTHNFYRSRMAKRLLQDFSYNVYEQGKAALQAKDHLKAAVFFELVAISSSRHPGVLCELASAYSLGKQKEKALKVLKEAVERGFSDAAKLETDKNFDSIREDSQFKALLDAIKKK